MDVQNILPPKFPKTGDLPTLNFAFWKKMFQHPKI